MDTFVVQKDTPVTAMARVIQLFQVVAVLLIQVGTMASDLVSLKDRVTKVETSHPIHHDTANLSQQVRELSEAMASQKEHIQTLSQELVEQRAEVSTYRNKMNVLTAGLDEDGKEFNQFVKGLHTTLQDEIKEQQRLSSELATVKEDMTQKMGLLHTGLAAVQFDLTVVKSVHGMVPPDIQLRGEVAREVRRVRIMACLAQTVEDRELAQEVEALCPIPTITISSAEENQPAPSGSSSARPQTAAAGNKVPAEQTEASVSSATKISRPSTASFASTAKGKEVEAGSRGPIAESVETVQSTPVSYAPTDANAVEPQSSSSKITRSAAGPEAKGSGIVKPRQSMLQAPRKSMPPAVLVKSAPLAASGKPTPPVASGKSMLPVGPRKSTLPAVPSKSKTAAASENLTPSVAPRKSKLPVGPRKSMLPVAPGKSTTPAAPRKSAPPGKSAPSVAPKKSMPPAASGKSTPPVAPRKSMLPVGPRKSMLPGLPKPTVKPAAPPAKEFLAQIQPKLTNTVTENRAPFESNVLARIENEAPPVLPASSSLAGLDLAMQESQVDILNLIPTLDSMALFDVSFSAVSLPTESHYSPVAANGSPAKPSRRL